MKANTMFICFDLMKFRTEYDALQLKQLCQYTGLTAKQASVMLARLDDDFYPLSEQETLNILENAKFKEIERFIQIASYAGYVAIRS